MRLRAVLVLLACAACTSLSDLSGGGAPDGGDAGGPPPVPPGTPPPPPGGDGGMNDAGADSGGVPSNLVPNPGFESAGGGCGPGWTSYGAILTRSTTAHGGGSSCQICVDAPDSGSAMQITAVMKFAVKAGATYSTEAWLRSADGMPATGDTGVQIFIDEPGNPQQYYQATQVIPSPTWTPSNGSFVVTADGQLQFDVHVYEPNNGCVLVDDVGVYPAN